MKARGQPAARQDDGDQPGIPTEAVPLVLRPRSGAGDVTPTAAQPVPASRASRRAVGGRVAALFDEHAAMVLGLCRLLLRDHHEAEDAAQQTFVSAYRALLRGTEPREPGPWLAAIARNECRERLRKRMRAPVALDADIELELSDSSDDLAELADRRAELSQLAVEIARLPSRQREAIALRDFLGLSYEEVASTLKVSVPVVESLLFRARRRLRDTVRTVPRYAAGIVMVPIAMRAAVAREVPDFDTVTVGLGVAGVAGAAASGVAKLLSVPASVKVAATVAVVATGSVVAPKLIQAPAEEHAAPRSAAIAATSTVQGEDREAVPQQPAATAAGATSAAEPAGPAPAAETSPGNAPAQTAPQAGDSEVAAEAELDPGRISSSVEAGPPLAPPPPPPPVQAAGGECAVAPVEGVDGASDPTVPAGSGDSGAACETDTGESEDGPGAEAEDQPPAGVAGSGSAIPPVEPPASETAGSPPVVGASPGPVADGEQVEGLGDAGLAAMPSPPPAG